MIRSLLFSLMGATLITLGIGFWVNNWFLHGYNWLWLAIPSFWLCYKGFSRIFKMLDIVIGIVIIIAIVYISQHGLTLPTFG